MREGAREVALGGQRRVQALLDVEVAGLAAQGGLEEARRACLVALALGMARGEVVADGAARGLHGVRGGQRRRDGREGCKEGEERRDRAARPGSFRRVMRHRRAT